MKYLVCAVIACVALTEARHLRYRRDTVGDKIKEIFPVDQFPYEEWEKFWTELTKAHGENTEIIQQKLTEHEGNMDLTLDDLKDKLGDKYPQIKQQWDKAQEKFDMLVKKLDEITLKDIINKIKELFYNNYNKDAAKEHWQSASAKAKVFWREISEKEI